MLAPARDLDVFVAETLPRMRDAGTKALADVASLEAALSPLAASAEARRRQARRVARAAIGSPRFQRLLLAAGASRDSRAAMASRRRARPVPPVAVSGQAFASAALRRLRRRVRKSGDGIATHAPAERHAFRIAAKKLRYATEFFAPWFPGKRARDYRKALTALQDALGVMNDARGRGGARHRVGGTVDAGPGAVHRLDPRPHAGRAAVRSIGPAGDCARRSRSGTNDARTSRPPR